MIGLYDLRYIVIIINIINLINISCLQIPKISGRATNLSLAKINLELGVTDPTESNVNKIVPHFPFATIFKNLVIRFNNVIVADYDNAYTWLASHMRLTKINQTLREVCDVTGKYGGDDYQNTMASAVPNTGSTKRIRRDADAEGGANAKAGGPAAKAAKPAPAPTKSMVEFDQEKWGSVGQGEALADRFELWSEGGKIYLSTYLFADLLVSSEPCIIGKILFYNFKVYV